MGTAMAGWQQVPEHNMSSAHLLTADAIAAAVIRSAGHWADIHRHCRGWERAVRSCAHGSLRCPKVLLVLDLALDDMGRVGPCGSMWVPILYETPSNLRSVYLATRAA